MLSAITHMSGHTVFFFSLSAKLIYVCIVYVRTYVCVYIYQLITLTLSDDGIVG